MNLRTRAIVFSALLLVILLLDAISETILQLRLTDETEHSRRSTAALGAIYDVEQDRLTAAGALRRQFSGDTKVAGMYAQAVSAMRASMVRLKAAAGPNPGSIEGARRVNSDAARLLESFDSVKGELRRGNVRAAHATMSSVSYLDLIVLLQQDAERFGDATRAGLDRQFRSVDDVRNTSIQLLLFALAGLLITSALAILNAGQNARALFELVRKSERSRRGETLGTPLGRRDEFGVLDAALHELVAAQEERERQLQRQGTELAQAKSKLEEYAHALEGRVQVSEEKFRGFLTASPDAMLVVDERGEIVLVSQRVQALFGYTPDELIARPFDLLMPERFRGAYTQHIRDVAQAPGVRELGASAERVRQAGLIRHAIVYAMNAAGWLQNLGDYDGVSELIDETLAITRSVEWPSVAGLCV